MISRHGKSMTALGVMALGASAAAAVVPSSSLAKPKPKPKVVTLVKVEDDFYSTKKLTIKRGNAIHYIWNKRNLDSHNVVLVSGPKGVPHKKFSSATGTSGIRFKPSFTRVGTYHFRCTIHPTGMYMTVIVKQ